MVTSTVSISPSTLKLTVYLVPSSISVHTASSVISLVIAVAKSNSSPFSSHPAKMYPSLVGSVGFVAVPSFSTVCASTEVPPLESNVTVNSFLLHPHPTNEVAKTTTANNIINFLKNLNSLSQTYYFHRLYSRKELSYKRFLAIIFLFLKFTPLL